MDPVSALREIAYYKELAREESRRVMAYRKAAEIIAGLSPQERERHGANKTWKSLTGLGPKTATVAAEAWAERSRPRSNNCGPMPRAPVGSDA